MLDPFLARLYCRDCGEEPRSAQVQLKFCFNFYKAGRGSGHLILEGSQVYWGASAQSGQKQAGSKKQVIRPIMLEW